MRGLVERLREALPKLKAVGDNPLPIDLALWMGGHYADTAEAARTIEALVDALRKIAQHEELEGFTDYDRMASAAVHITYHRDVARAALSRLDALHSSQATTHD